MPARLAARSGSPSEAPFASARRPMATAQAATSRRGAIGAGVGGTGPPSYTTAERVNTPPPTPTLCRTHGTFSDLGGFQMKLVPSRPVRRLLAGLTPIALVVAALPLL